MTKRTFDFLDKHGEKFRMDAIEKEATLPQGTLSKILRGVRKGLSPDQEAGVRKYFQNLKKNIDKYLAD